MSDSLAVSSVSFQQACQSIFDQIKGMSYSRSGNNVSINT